jgi:hypothetical protein
MSDVDALAGGARRPSFTAVRAPQMIGPARIESLWAVVEGFP